MGSPAAFAYRAVTCWGPVFQPVRLGAGLLTPLLAVLQPRKGLRLSGLGCFPFARRYWGNHGCFLFLRVLRWFTSPGGLVLFYGLEEPSLDFVKRGYPIGRSPDRSLFAAPRGLSQLTTSFLAF